MYINVSKFLCYQVHHRDTVKHLMSKCSHISTNYLNYTQLPHVSARGINSLCVG